MGSEISVRKGLWGSMGHQSEGAFKKKQQNNTMTRSKWDQVKVEISSDLAYES